MKSVHALPFSSRWMLAAACLLHWWSGTRARGENHADFRWSDYKEGDNRIRVVTQSGLVEVSPADWMSLKVELVHDAISGSSPTGARQQANGVLPVQYLEDVRRAVSVKSDIRIGRVTLRPQFSYSIEHDYRSTGIALSTSVDFNEKNTTLTLGLSHDFDSVFPARPDVTNVSFRGRKAAADKDSTDILLGVTQLLTPKTLLTVNLSVGFADGYLNDPYKRVTFERSDGTLTPLARENRPHNRAKQIVYVSLTQAVDPLDASVETSYRYYHDTFRIHSHTASVQWFQKLGRHVVLAPMFRYMHQSASSFYAPYFLGDTSPFADPVDAALVPSYYSSDYRLASIHTLTYGVEATIIATDWLHFNFSYSRYEMRRNEQASPASAFPNADIFTAGARVWF